MVAGNLVYIPLRIEDKDTKKTIVDGCLYLHIEECEEGRILTGSIPEGSYRAVVSRDQWRDCRVLDYDGWMEQMDLLLPIDTQSAKKKTQIKTETETEIKTEEPEIKTETDTDKGETHTGETHTGEGGDLELHAKLIMNAKDYEDQTLNEEYDVVDNYLTISIRSKSGVLRKTYGSFQMNIFEEGIDIFEWIKSLIELKNQLVEDRVTYQATIRSYELEISQYKQSLEQTENTHEKIITNLSVNFQHILASKKEKILQLMTKTQGDLNVNEIYKEKNKNNLENMTLDEDKLDQLPDELPERVSKRKAPEKHKPRKRNKKPSNSPVASDTDEDNEDTNLLKMTDRDIIDTVLADEQEEEHQQEHQEQEPQEEDTKPKDQAQNTDVSDSDAEYIKQEIESGELDKEDSVQDSLTDYSE